MQTSSTGAAAAAPKGPRVLLRHLREAMAEQLGPQERLNRIVQQIAGALSAQVCSVYVLRADDVLELFATEGLSAEAVHRAELRVGKGLVGTVAETGKPLNTGNAHAHPAFQYIPEAGEDDFNSFMGVPMKRAGRGLGVIAVQRRQTQAFMEEEVEALETAAMVLSDLVASGDLRGLAQEGRELDSSRAISRQGMRLAPGIAIGRAVLHEPRVVITNFFNQDEETELRRLSGAIQALRDDVDAMVLRGFTEEADQPAAEGVPEDGEHKEVLESYRMFAHSRGWVRRIEDGIRDGLTAEAATERASQENRTSLMRSPDPYLRERLHDLDDLSRRLLRQLLGKAQQPILPDSEEAEPFIVLASTMGAAELLDYPRAGLRGLVLEEATPTSHVTIVARALGIAVVGQAGGIVSRTENGQTVVVDGNMGIVHLRPPASLIANYDERVKYQAEQAARYAGLREQPSVTTDGTAIALMLNAGLTMDLPQLDTTGASGIGLFRTELQFMVSASLPRVKEQAAFYASVLDAAGDKPVTFRTLDIGGDKVLPYLRTIKEDNPALGWRAIRLSIDRPGLLRMQLRALLRAAAGRHLRIKLPMVTVVTEIDRVRAMLDAEIASHEKFGHTAPSRIELGAMIEVPSLLWQLDELMTKVDFVSVGSNDLFQFMVASDRTNTYLANRFNPLARPFLRALREIARAADRHETELQLCGELSGEPLSAMALLGIGYRMISMPPSSIGPVKEMVRTVDLAHLRAAVDAAVDAPIGGQTMQEMLTDYADQHGVPV